MADTQRTSADLLANLFQDGQGDGSITAQDVRDMIVSMVPKHGTATLNTPAETVISTAGVFVKVAGTTTNGILEGFTMPADNRLAYVEAPGRHVNIMITFSITAAANNQDLAFKIAINGVVVDATEIVQRIGTGADKQSLMLTHIGTLATNDFIELWGTNTTSTANITVTSYHMVVTATMD